MIREWQKQDGCWTSIGSPDFDQERQLRGYLAIQKLGLSNLSGVKKKCLWLLWNGVSKFLRSQGAASQRFVVWRGGGLFGCGGAPCNVSPLPKGKAREIRLAFKQSFLYKAFLSFCRAEMPEDEHSGCNQGNKVGLAHDQRAGQAIYGGTVKTRQEDKAGSNWDRRDIDKERTRISDSGKRLRTRLANLVWGKGSFRGKHGYVLSVAGRKKELKNQAGSHGHVEGVREIDTKKRTNLSNSLRQVSCDKAFRRSAGQDSEAGIRTAFRRWPQIYQRAKVCSVVQPGESDIGRKSLAEGATESKQASQHGVFAQGIIRAIMGLSDGRVGAQVFRELEGVAQMAAAQALRKICGNDRKTLGRDSRLQQAGEQSVVRICGRTQQQDKGNSTESLWLKRRELFALESAYLYVGGDLN